MTSSHTVMHWKEPSYLGVCVCLYVWCMSIWPCRCKQICTDACEGEMPTTRVFSQSIFALVSLSLNWEVTDSVRISGSFCLCLLNPGIREVSHCPRLDYVGDWTLGLQHAEQIIQLFNHLPSLVTCFSSQTLGELQLEQWTSSMICLDLKKEMTNYLTDILLLKG